MTLAPATRTRMAMMAAGVTQAAVARATDLKPTTVSAVVHGRGRSAVIEHTIAAMTGLPLHQLWPDWYAASGAPIKRRRARPASPRQIEEALHALQAGG